MICYLQIEIHLAAHGSPVLEKQIATVMADAKEGRVNSWCLRSDADIRVTTEAGRILGQLTVGKESKLP